MMLLFVEGEVIEARERPAGKSMDARDLSLDAEAAGRGKEAKGADDGR